MSDSEIILSGVQKKGLLTTNDKRWLKERLDEQRSHELKLAFTNACGNNPDIPFITMFLFGGLSTAAGMSIEYVTSKSNNENGDWIDNIAAEKGWDDAQEAEFRSLISRAENAEKIGDFFSLLTLSPALIGANYTLKPRIKEIFEETPTTWVGFAASGLKTLGEGLMIFAAAILILRSIFGNSTKDGGMQSLAGLMTAGV